VACVGINHIDDGGGGAESHRRRQVLWDGLVGELVEH